MTKKIICLFFFSCVLIEIFYGQSTGYNKISELSVGVGYMEYMNTVNVESGLPGLSTRLEYCHQIINKFNSNIRFEYLARLNYAYLIKPKYDGSGINYPFHHAEIFTSAIWTYQIKELLPNLKFDIGGGALLNIVAGINSSNYFSEFYKFNPYGNWYVAPSVRLGLTYRFKDILFKAKLTTPIFLIGFFQEFQNYPDKYSEQLSYIITPNTCVFLDKYRQASVDLSAYIPLKITKNKRLDLKIDYYFDGQSSQINYNIERKRNQGLALGFVIER